MMKSVVVLALALASVTPLKAQQRLGGQLAAFADSLVTAAKARGLPADPVMEKAIEGSAKGVPAERVIQALRVVMDQLDTAAAELRVGGISGDTVAIAAGGFAITAGLHGQDVAALAQTGRPAAEVTVGLRVAGTLTALGVPPAETVKLVSTELRLGRPTAELLSLPSSVQGEIARGATPAQAASGLARAAAAQAGGPGGVHRGPPPGKGPPTHPTPPPHPAPPAPHP
jgi:hypothetical protein